MTPILMIGKLKPENVMWLVNGKPRYELEHLAINFVFTLLLNRIIVD